MRCLRLITILLTALSLQSAELTFTSVTASSITHSSAGINWNITGTVNASKRVAWDTKAYSDANSGAMRYKTIGDATQSYDTTSIGLTGLAASTTYVACPEVTAGADSSICTTAGSRVEFTTSALPGTHPAEPTAVDLSGFDYTYPGSFAATLTVATDCSDLTSTITTAFSATYSGQNVKVVVPSDRHKTAACTTMPTIPEKSGAAGFWVVIESDDVALLPVSTRVTEAQHTSQYFSSYKGSDPTTAAFGYTGTSPEVRFVGIRIYSGSTAASGDGDPQIWNYLQRIDGGVSNLIFDRSMLDCGGYPQRTRFAIYGKGDNIAMVDSLVRGCYVWEPWIGDVTITRATTATLTSTAAVKMGRGDQVCSLPTWEIVLNGGSGTGTGTIYVDSSCVITFKYTPSMTAPSCTNVTCTQDAALTVPASGRTIVYPRVFDITNATFKTAGGTDTAIVADNTHLADLLTATGSVSSNDAEWGGYVWYGDSTGTTDNYVFYNNRIECSGICLFSEFSGGSGVVTDVLIQRNTFVAKGLITDATSASSSPYFANRRHFIEFKVGQRIRITGNTFEDGFTPGINGAFSISLKRDNGTTQDIKIDSNWDKNGVAFLNIQGDAGNSMTGLYTTSIARVLVENNLVNTNGYRRQWYVDSEVSVVWGYFLWMDQTMEDLIVRHNTVWQQRGYGGTILFTDRWVEGVSIKDNIFFIHSPFTPVRGIHSRLFMWTTDSVPAVNTASGSDGTTALTNSQPQGHTVSNNVFLAACLTPLTCDDSTVSGSLVTDISAQYPSGNFWKVTGTFGARQDDVGWTNRASNTVNGFILSSGNHRAGQSEDASDNTDVGINALTLEQALGGTGYTSKSGGGSKIGGGAKLR